MFSTVFDFVAALLVDYKELKWFADLVLPSQTLVPVNYSSFTAQKQLDEV